MVGMLIIITRKNSKIAGGAEKKPKAKVPHVQELALRAD